MTNIKIDIKALEEPIKKSNNLAERTDNLLNEFNSQKICIDNIICERDNIKYDLDKIGTEIKLISERFTKYGKQINGVINAYEYAERELNKMLMVLEPPSKKEKNDNDIKPADVTVGDVKIGNTMVSNGITTGNLIDIVKGLGGTVSWDETSKTATVIINGKTTSYNLNNIKDGFGYASDGSTFTVKDGHIQVGIREISEKAGANVKWSPTSLGVKVDVDYIHASVSSITKVTKDSGEAGELWVSDNIVIFEQEGSRSHVRYPVKDGYATAWIDTDKLNVGVKVTSDKQVIEPASSNNMNLDFSDLDKITLSYANGDVLPLTDKQKQAIKKIQTYQNHDYIKQHQNQTQIYLFEGTAVNKDKKEKYSEENGKTLYKDRYGAILVVVKDGQIAYITPEASTLPDYPRGPNKYNGYTDMPTLVDGVYSFRQTSHPANDAKGNNSSYPALKILSTKGEEAEVVRYSTTKGKWKSGTSGGINFHMGYRHTKEYSGQEIDGNFTPKIWVNSSGCQTVRPGGDNQNWTRYNEIAEIIGFDKDGFVKYGEAPDNVKGIFVVDRSFMDPNENNYKDVLGDYGIEYIKHGTKE
ncbi:stalk domain-containing protein [Vallitalea guaymasensis]|uniref:Uncharacterized protein n=1 Tax=Vallitalea guaymasensis TaxID=1185412 RepID=A0A8J8MAB0_9FIRM|nr:stalk domain-containing protein [Vallitalea guaymasensis]QUH29247.1 hypothetical protein HYG85_10040 [Vallitalea guaymasensis]